MTKRERRGRLWLAIFTVTLALCALIRLAITAFSLT
jgi:hypothetical protein